MTSATRPAIGPLVIVPCPLCDEPAVIDDEAGALECAACGTRLDVAGEPEAAALAPAA